MKTRSKAFHAVLTAILLVPSLAAAQETDTELPPAPAHPAPPPPRPLPMPLPAPAYDPAVTLDLFGDEPLTVTVYSLAEGRDSKRALFTCRTPCRVRIVPGKYRFHVRGGPTKIEADRVVEVNDHEALRFSLPEQSAKSGALTTAIAGTVLAPLGLLVLFASAMSNSCFGDCGSDTEARNRATPAGVYVGLGMFVTGAVLTPVGWVAFAKSRKPAVESTPLYATGREEARKPARPRIGFGVTPARGGANAAVWGTF